MSKRDTIQNIRVILAGMIDNAESISDEDYEKILKIERILTEKNLKEKILDFIEDNYPTEVHTDWERGCAYVLDEIEKIVKQK